MVCDDYYYGGDRRTEAVMSEVTRTKEVLIDGGGHRHSFKKTHMILGI